MKQFVRYDNRGKIVNGSNIRRHKKPLVGNWVEIPDTICCVPSLSTTTTTTILLTTTTSTTAYNGYIYKVSNIRYHSPDEFTCLDDMSDYTLLYCEFDINNLYSKFLYINPERTITYVGDNSDVSVLSNFIVKGITGIFTNGQCKGVTLCPI